MNYFIQAKLNQKVLSEFNQITNKKQLDNVVSLLSEQLKFKADLLEIYSFDTLLDQDSIELIKEIHLS